MFCKACGASIEESNKFCPVCGTKVEPVLTAVYEPPERTREFDRFQTEAYVSSGGAADPDMEQELPRKPATSPEGYGDSFIQHREPRFSDSGWRDRSQSSRKQYQKTSGGQKAVCVILCLLMLCFGFPALVISTARIALTETNVRKACQKGTIADLEITTDQGKRSVTEIFMDNVVDAQTNLPIPLDKAAVEKFFRTQSINNFIENLTVEFTQFFVFGKTPTLLNEPEITRFLRSTSDQIREQIGYMMSDADIETIGARINGGDLSFLSIDENGGYFRTSYGFDPKMISFFFSDWSLAISIGLTLLCMVLIFVITRRDLPAGLSFNGGTMIIFGALNILLAVAGLILSYLVGIYFLSAILRDIAIACGAISLCVLVAGIVFNIIKTVLRNRL